MNRVLGFSGVAAIAWFAVTSVIANERGLAGVSAINRIMLLAHLRPGNRGTRDNLDNKVLDGKATDEEKQKLLDLYTELAQQSPPNGDLDAWKTRTETLVSSLKDFYAGKEGSRERFVKAKDCKSCHLAHRSGK